MVGTTIDNTVRKQIDGIKYFAMEKNDFNTDFNSDVITLVLPTVKWNEVDQDSSTKEGREEGAGLLSMDLEYTKP